MHQHSKKYTIIMNIKGKNQVDRVFVEDKFHEQLTDKHKKVTLIFLAKFHQQMNVQNL
jgi:hypothetical protein